MFTVDRVFSVQNPKSGLTEWYFQAREGNVGPYETKAEAKSMLQSFIKKCIETKNTGGRGKNCQSHPLALETQAFLNFEVTGTINWY